MKICMPVLDDKGLNSLMHGHFGSAPFFAIYDTENNNVTVIKNGNGEHEHGQCMPVDAIRMTGADAVICRGMGMRAANLLVQAGITPYMAEAETVSDAISQFKAKKVVIMDASRACQAHGCH